MPRLAIAFVEIKAITGKYKASIAQAKRLTNRFGKDATKSIRRVTLGLTAMGVAAAIAAAAIGVKLAQALVRAARSSIQAAIKYDKLERGLLAIAGSTEEANKQLIRLREVAKLPGLSFADAIQGSTALQAAGLSANLAERSLRSFGNALVTVGKGVEDLKGVNLALTQIVTKGQGFGQELRQLSERLPQVRKAMKDAFGIASVEDFQRLGLTATEFIEGLVIEFEKLPLVTGTVANSIENMAISFDLLKRQVGKLFIDEVQQSADSLTGIIDKLTLVVRAYKDYRLEAAQVFRDLALIGVRLTGEMVLGMGAIVVESAKIIWVPLKFAVIQTFKDINDSVEIGMIKMMGTIREFFGGDAEIAKLQIQTVKRSRAVWDQWFATIRNADFDEAIRKGLLNIEADLTRTFNAMMAAFNRADSVVSKFTDKLPKESAEAAKKGIAEIRKVTADELDFLGVSGVGLRELTELQEGARQRIMDFRNNVGKDLEDRQAKNLANFREFMDESRRIAEEVADAIRPAFENLFENLFTGDTKNLWEQFWIDLKRIAIRQMAQIFATQLLAGLLTGGVSFGAVGLGSAFSALAPQSIDPTSRAIGSAISRGASAVGGFLEGGQKSNTFVFNQTDFANMDPVRLAKTASQQIGPALAEERLDGR